MAKARLPNILYVVTLECSSSIGEGCSDPNRMYCGGLQEELI